MPNKSEFQIMKNLEIRNFILMKLCFGIESNEPKNIFEILCEEKNVEVTGEIKVSF